MDEIDKAFLNPKSRKVIEENQSSFLDDETPEERKLNDRQYEILLERSHNKGEEKNR